MPRNPNTLHHSPDISRLSQLNRRYKELLAAFESAIEAAVINSPATNVDMQEHFKASSRPGPAINIVDYDRAA